MTAALTTIAPVIKINGALASSLVLEQLDGLRISRALGLPGRAVLKFADIGYTVTAGQVFGIGTEVEITSPAGTSLFQGEVTGVEMLLDRGQIKDRNAELFATFGWLAGALALSLGCVLLLRLMYRINGTEADPSDAVKKPAWRGRHADGSGRRR